MNRRLFLKRASQACGVVVFLPVVGSLNKVFGASAERYFEHTIVAMGTTARVGVYAKSEVEANAVISKAFQELKRLESLFSIYDAKSEISKLNANAGGAPLKLSADSFSILHSALFYAKLTRHAFDPTVEPLMELWGFRNGSNQLHALPSSQQINAALQYVSAEQIELDQDHSTARLRSHGMRVDLGGIAVGYALDKMAEIIRHAGIERAFIDISGDMYAMGAPDNKPGWEVAIPDPQNTARLIHKTHITDKALATSGNYMSYVVYHAMRYGHIMDPHEGVSANKVLSATVIADRGIDADALSTASFVSAKRYCDTHLILVGPSGKIEED